MRKKSVNANLKSNVSAKKRKSASSMSVSDSKRKRDCVSKKKLDFCFSSKKG